jgi:hypothetical protein
MVKRKIDGIEIETSSGNVSQTWNYPMLTSLGSSPVW